MSFRSFVFTALLALLGMRVVTGTAGAASAAPPSERVGMRQSGTGDGDTPPLSDDADDPAGFTDDSDDGDDALLPVVSLPERGLPVRVASSHRVVIGTAQCSGGGLFRPPRASSV